MAELKQDAAEYSAQDVKQLGEALWAMSIRAAMASGDDELVSRVSGRALRRMSPGQFF